MIDLDLVLACADTYLPDAPWEDTFEIEGVWFATRKRGDGSRVIAFRGSRTPEDWFRDFQGWPVLDPEVGYCEHGFHEAMRDVLLKWLATRYEDARLWVTGHSLGAARAAIMAALLVKRDLVPQGLVVFGCPRPGFFKLRRTIRSGKFPVRVYSNRGDPVPDVPVPFWHILPYRHPAKPIMLSAGPKPGDPGPLSSHHISQYVEGIRAFDSGAR